MTPNLKLTRTKKTNVIRTQSFSQIYPTLLKKKFYILHHLTTL